MAVPPSHEADSGVQVTQPGAWPALLLLLGINLFNYIDRQILSAVLPLLELDAALFNPADRLLEFKLGLLTSAFLVSYTIFSPIFGRFGDTGRRWFIVALGVTIWSLASGASGLATGFVMMLLTRCLVGIGEAAYGPVAPSMISDLFPLRVRGKVISLFYLAIPVGSALGFVLGGLIADLFGWRVAFLVTLIGLLPAVVCFFMEEPARPAQRSAQHTPYWQVIRELTTIKSFILCCLGMTATTFMLGGVAAWAPRYIFQREARFEVTTENLAKLQELTTSTGERVVPDAILTKVQPLVGTGTQTYADLKAELLKQLGEADLQQYGERIYSAVTRPDSIGLGKVNFFFGVIVVVSGLGATLLGGLVGDFLRNRGVKGAYLHTAGWTTLLGYPFFIAVLYVPFPTAWILLFLAVFFLFFNTGPANTVLANSTRSQIRATAFAVNILVIHLLGDVISPPIIGLIASFTDLGTAFFWVALSILLGGGLWILGAKYLDADTARAQ